MGRETAALLLKLANLGGLDAGTRQVQQELIDRICRLLIDALRHQGLSDCDDQFLAVHGETVQNTILDEHLRRLPPQYE